MPETRTCNGCQVLLGDWDHVTCDGCEELYHRDSCGDYELVETLRDREKGLTAYFFCTSCGSIDNIGDDYSDGD
jgi:hypothetical protein